MNWLQKVRALSPAERNLFRRAVWCLWLVQIRLKLQPFASVRRWEQRASGRAFDINATARGFSLDRLAQVLRLAGRALPFSGRCLPRALMAQIMLKRLGHEPELKIGVAREGRTLDAHAWVECEGRVIVGDAELERYSVLPPLPDSEKGAGTNTLSR
jgi:hypothetical protein